MTDIARQADARLISIIRALSPIEDQIRAQGTDLAPAADGNLYGDCPACDGYEGRLMVAPCKGLFYCGSCTEGGDVVRWVQLTQDVAFLTAVDLLAGSLMLKIEEHRVVVA